MHKEVADKWVKALRSGKYKQGYGCLRQQDNDGVFCYCPLGVLCQLAPGVKPVKSNDLWLYRSRTWFPDSSFSTLPLVVVHWAKMWSHTGAISGLFTSVVDLNDTQHKSFTDVADIIETHYEAM